MESVFKRRKEEDSKDYNIHVLTGSRTSQQKGVVGLEIEVEGTNLKKSGLPRQWSYHEDGSLRGDDNAEYVLARPLPFEEVDTALDDLWKMFETSKTVLADSNRTSVHVHLNVQDFYLNRLASFCAIYFILEEILTEWCGEHRVGNLFCLRAKDAPAIITQITKFIQRDGDFRLAEQTLKYSAMNFATITKFGSVEARTLRGVLEPQPIKDWVGMLRRIYEVSAEFKDPRDIIAGKFSGEGPLAFFDDILGDKSVTLRQGILFNEDDIRQSMYEGMRMAQEICYCRDWSKYRPTEYVPDPFGRDVRKKRSAMEDYLAMAAQNTQWAAAPSFASVAPAPVAEPDWDVGLD
jgi:hypothetical protein